MFLIGTGSYLSVSPTGAKSWRFDYRFAGKRRVLVYGLYPAVGLADARDKHAEAKRALAKGEDPALLKQRAKQKQRIAATNTFRAIAKEWIGSLESKRSRSWKKNNTRWLTEEVYPSIGSRLLDEITVTDVRTILDRMGAVRNRADARFAT